MAPQADTHYGALTIEETSAPKSGRSATLKFLVGLALLAVCVTAAVFAFTEPAVQTQAVTGAENIMQQEKRRGEDCECKEDCKPSGTAGELGTCEVKSENCYGYDNEKAEKDKDGKWMAKCEVFSGRYNCWTYPCKNEGICMEEVNSFSCKCPYGFQGALCEDPVPFCKENVCAKDSTCKECLSKDGDCEVDGEKLPKRKVGDQAYWCTCNSGFFGDGYPKDQDKVFGGSVLSDKKLKGSTRYYGWLKRIKDQEACTDVDDCQHELQQGAKVVKTNPCKNGGKCTDLYKDKGLVNAFECDCSVTLKASPPKRWTGRICEEDVDECKKGFHTCVSDVDWRGKPIAQCINSAGSFSCKCLSGWEGDAHTKKKSKDSTGCKDVDDCAKLKPCKNSGTCIEGRDGTGEYSCQCKKTWKGKHCETDVNECTEKGKITYCESLDKEGRCENKNDGFRCVCNNGYTGEPSASPPKKCVDEDDCASKPCGDAGTCKDLLRGFQCTCKPGFRGKKCDEDWDECALGIDTCHKHAACYNTHGSYECACMPGYSGTGTEAGRCVPVNNCHLFNGDIVRKDKNGDPVEQCGEWDSATNIYHSHGECKRNEQSFTCNCNVGWTNHDCKMDVDECTEGVHACARNANCENLTGPQDVNVEQDPNKDKRIVTLGYKCKCNLGYTGDPYSERCPDIDDCTYTHPTCKKGGQMCATDGDCKTATHPDDTCDSSKQETRCVNGDCKDLGEHSWTCNCMEGWTDANCGTDIDECSDHTRFECAKNAHCVNTKGSYMCKCNTGYLGDGQQCEEIDDCASNPCAHGNCTDHGATGYGCTCEAGYIDSKCDHDENECIAGKDGCHAQGVCVNSPGSYYCRCISGMVGDGWICTDLDDCDPNPCSKNVLSGTYKKFGKLLKHNGCKDTGANQYQCKCKPGYEGKFCERPVNECEKESLNKCDKNAICSESKNPPQDGELGYTCRCKRNFYGDGFSCAACTDCSRKAPYGGWKRDASRTYCNTKHIEDNVCVNVNECETGQAKCHQGRAQCEDTPGSYNCKCNAEYWTKIRSKGMRTKREGEPAHKCYRMTTCKLGEIMVRDGNQFNDRVCRPILPNGFYAIETRSTDVQQCLTMWNEASKVFPERYNWGGVTLQAARNDPQNRPGYIAPADKCKNPICGVCNFNGATSKNNIKLGDVASFNIARVEGDTYLILANRAGKGTRCLGFDRTGDDEIPAPYPQLISWQKHEDRSTSGKCAKRDGAKVVVDKKVCKKDGDCDSGKYCLKQTVEDGTWTSDGKGTEDAPYDEQGNLQYFCGLNSVQELKTAGNSQTLWNIHALGCKRDTVYNPPRWECSKQKYGTKFLIRSLADGDKLNSGNAANPSFNAHCLYFPKSNGPATNPRRVPASGNVRKGGIWGGSAYAGPPSDSNPDHECGIVPRKGESQEQALLRNKQAVFNFVNLAVDQFDIRKQ